MEKNIVVIEGDGIGPEVTRQSVKVLNTIAEQFGHTFHYTYCLMGADAIDKTGNPLPDRNHRSLPEQRCHFVWRYRASEIR